MVNEQMLQALRLAEEELAFDCSRDEDGPIVSVRYHDGILIGRCCDRALRAVREAIESAEKEIKEKK